VTEAAWPDVSEKIGRPYGAVRGWRLLPNGGLTLVPSGD